MADETTTEREPVRMTTTTNVTFTTTLTLPEAVEVLGRVPLTHPDGRFCRSMFAQFHDRGLTRNQVPFAHLQAEKQLERERDPNYAAPVTPTRTRTARTEPTEDTTKPPEPLRPDRGEASDLAPCFLIYDIPQSVDFPNPSNMLRRRAVRVNLSCWAIPEQRVPYSMLNEMTTAGGNWHVIPIRQDAVDKLLDLVASCLKNEIAEGVDRMNESMGAAGERAEEDAQQKHIDKAAERCRKLLGDLREAADCFGLSMSDFDVTSAWGRVRTLQMSAYSKAKMVAEAAKLLPDDGSRAAAEADDLPAGIMADMLEDQGVDSTEFRRTFALPGVSGE